MAQYQIRADSTDAELTSIYHEYSSRLRKAQLPFKEETLKQDILARRQALRDNAREDQRIETLIEEKYPGLKPRANTPDPRLPIEKLREKAAVAYDNLEKALDEAGHGPDCVLRCIENPTHDYVHECSVCGDDEGIGTINRQEHE
jgi:hypothetical protein